MSRFKMFVLISLMALAGVIACGDDEPTVAAPDTILFEFSFSNMDSLDNAYYQAWALIADGGAYRVGKFNVTSSGQLIDTTGASISGNSFVFEVLPLNEVYGVGVTIQPEVDTAGTVSPAHLLGGDVSNGSASLTIDHAAGVNQDFSSVSGKYILATPTNGIDNDENSGLWYIDNVSGISTAGLVVPTLESGWLYEGWIRVNGNYYSTGTFSSPSASDDTSRYSSNLQPSPTFPGEDFLVGAPSGVTFPLDLSGEYTMITLEPSPDEAPDSPTSFKILEAAIPSDATDHTVYQLTSTVSSALPSGTVTLTVQ